MKIINLLKRPFCSHSYRTCTFQTMLLGKVITYPCTDLKGRTLFECTKCGKQIIEVTE